MSEHLLDVLKKRGFIDALAGEELYKHLKSPRKIYIGFDPTADSLHLGNLVGIIALKWCEKFGHTPVVLLGGGTGKIGDPSGKDKERPLLQFAEIDANVQAIERQFTKCLDKPLVCNNDEWLSGYGLIAFLRDVGKHFRMGPMLSKESVRLRLNSEEGMSLTEFSYQVLQGYDFYHLFKHHQVSVQMGGSDQWGNIVAGIDLTRKVCQESVFGCTFPLLVRSDGKKFGKSESGAIWLCSEKVSPYKFYQYLYSMPDADVGKLMRLLTFMDLDEIKDYERGEGEPNRAQKRLAEEVTRFVHGEEGLEAAMAVTQVVAPGSSADLSVEAIEAIASDMPSAHFTKDEALNVKIVKLIAKAGFLSSRSEVTRLIEGGGAYLNNQKLTDPAAVLQLTDLIGDRYCIFGAGKKRKLLMVIES